MEKSVFTLYNLILVSLLAIFFIGPDLMAEKKLRVGVSPLPPWKMEIEGKLEGPEIEILKAIGKKLNMEVSFQVIPFKRALHSMKKGDLDIMSGLLKRSEREKYIHFIEPPYKTKSNKVFYIAKERSVKILKYHDLYNHTIGIKLGVHYFPQFDLDTKLKKEAVADNIQNLHKLVLGHIDTTIITDSEGDYLIKKLGYEGKVKKVKFGYYKKNFVYFGVSKTSTLSSRLKEIELIIQKMTESGEIDKIITDYFKKHNLPVPQYK